MFIYFNTVVLTHNQEHFNFMTTTSIMEKWNCAGPGMYTVHLHYTGLYMYFILTQNKVWYKKNYS